MVQYHVLILSYPAQGHLNPTLQFAKRLLGMGVRVTLVTTISVHRRMTKKPIIDGLTIATFSDGYDDGLSATTNDKINLYLSDLKRRGSEALSNLIVSNAGHPFTVLVYTLLVPWVAEVARGLNLPSALLWIQPATVLDIYYYYLRDYSDYIKNKSRDHKAYIELPGLPLLTNKDLPSFIQPSNVYYFAIPSFEEHLQELEKETKPRVLVNTFEELEPEALRAVDKLNMIPIGPLIPSAFLDGKDPSDTSFGCDIFPASNGYIEWLDSKAESSVVYVSFGSISTLSRRQMEEVACALLDSGWPFLWVIRDYKGKKGDEQKEKQEDGEEEEKLIREEEKGKEQKGKEEKEGEEQEEELRCREQGKKGEERKENEEDDGELNCREKEEKGKEKENKGEEEEEEEELMISCRKELEKKGKIVNWCSQLEVLSHPSVGCFLTHCGWNSTMESLVSGVPVVAFPQWTDQGTNAKLIEDVWKTGMRVVVNEEGIAESKEIRRCLDVVMGREEKGEEMRRKANTWKDLARKAVKEGGTSDKNLRAFVNEFGE